MSSKDSETFRPIPSSALTSSKPIDSQWRYPGRELENMAFATNYHQWILDIFRPFLGKRIVEVGAGSGSFSELLLEIRPERLDVVEPSANLYPLLAERLRAARWNDIGRAHQGTLGGNVDSIRSTGAPDSVIYVNVLEHIEDDNGELRRIHSLLEPGGHALIFVPAHRWLMGSMDHELGHYRRYTRPELVEKCRAAGFTIKLASYFDVLGIVPWWLQYRVLRSRTMSLFAVRLYDCYFVPVSRFVQTVFRPPMGKNIILVAEKPGA